MQYATLGNTGTFVSRFCLGAMTFGGTDTPAGNAIGRLSQAETDVVVGQALDAGINFIDTADVYGSGSSETLLGHTLKKRRHDVVLATKFSGRSGKGPNQVGQSRLHLMNSLEASLTRLQTDHVDLYQIHNFDPLTPIEEALRSLDDAVRQGKVRYIGCSNLAAWQLMKALGISNREQLSSFVSVQSFYSLACRDVEAELVPAVTDAKLGLLCWSPLAGGLLSGKFDRRGTTDPSSRRATIQFPPVDERKLFNVIDVLKDVAHKHNSSPAQIALAWLLSRLFVTSVIVGIKTREQLTDNLKAFDITLTDDDQKKLDEASCSRARYPGWIQSYNAKGRVPAGFPFNEATWSLGERPI
ncbi:aldo/keto reductase [Tardiphaga sp. 619_E2_N8_5]|uniref:aldo/keto reductase n=1 Tax=unclassified Tardiphaga TaxID=2631404 RepID=UPI003F293EB8